VQVAAIALFIVFYLAVTFLWRVPVWVAALYGCMSAFAFVAYAIDKSAARSARGRISEKALLLLGLAGGWPGAIIAQQWLRHKSSKVSFRLAFWATVAANVAAFIFLFAPSVWQLLRW